MYTSAHLHPASSCWCQSRINLGQLFGSRCKRKVHEIEVLRSGYETQGVRIRQRSSHRIRVVAGEEGGEEPKKTVSTKRTLEELDQQLSTLSTVKDSPATGPRQFPEPGESSQQKRPTKQDNAFGDGAPQEWPEFDAGFLGFLGFVLMMITVVNNILYKVFLGPPVVPINGKPMESSAGPEPGFRITSIQQERDAAEAKLRERLRKLDAQLGAPPLADEKARS